MTRLGMIFEKRRGRLVPAGALDAEDFDVMPEGAQFELKSLTRRSLPQAHLYWQVLENVVQATGRWPTRYHLHDALRRDLGYIHVQRDLAGEPYLAVDSTAFDAMSAEAFGVFFEQAMARLADVTQCDPLAFLDERRAA
jgi:hypothetical protein